MVIPRGRTRTASFVVRTARLAVAAGLLVVVAATPAGATMNPSLSLDPADLDYGLGTVDNVGAAAAQGPAPASTLVSPVDVHWAGHLTITLPPGLVDDGSLQVTLDVGGGTAGSASVAYDSNPAAGLRRLRVTSLPGNRLRVELPANDGVHGPMGSLTMTHFSVRGGIDVSEGKEQSYVLRFSAHAPAAVALSPQLLLFNSLPADGTPSVAVAAGAAFDVSLPADARLSRLGIPGLRTAAFSLRRQDDAGDVAGSPIALSPVLTNDGRTTILTTPSTTPPGSYRLEAVVGDDTGMISADVQELLQVREAALGASGASDAAPPAMPMGWILPLALGGALLLVAAAAGVAGIPGSRRRTAPKA